MINNTNTVDRLYALVKYMLYSSKQNKYSDKKPLTFLIQNVKRDRENNLNALIFYKHLTFSFLNKVDFETAFFS